MQNSPHGEKHPEYLKALDDVVTFMLRMAEACDTTADVLEHKYGHRYHRTVKCRLLARTHHDMATFIERKKRS